MQIRDSELRLYCIVYVKREEAFFSFPESFINSSMLQGRMLQETAKSSCARVKILVSLCTEGLVLGCQRPGGSRNTTKFDIAFNTAIIEEQ